MENKCCCCTATWAGQRFYGLLKNILVAEKAGVKGQDLRVHSVFGKVINLSWGDNLLSIVQEGLGNAAGFLVVEAPENLEFTGTGVSPAMGISINDLCLKVGKVLAVDCRQLREWRGRNRTELSWQSSNLPGENLRALKEAISRWGIQGGAGELSRPSLIDDSRLTGALACLKKALLREAEFNLYAALAGMLGYGPGLTPSGDDVLLGFLAAAHSGAEYQALLPKLRQAVESNLTRTTDVSRHVLRQALAGEFHEYLQEVLHAVSRKSPESVWMAAKKLLRLGATSGTDIATGIYLAFSWGIDAITG